MIPLMTAGLRERSLTQSATIATSRVTLQGSAAAADAHVRPRAVAMTLAIAPLNLRDRPDATIIDETDPRTVMWSAVMTGVTTNLVIEGPEAAIGTKGIPETDTAPAATAEIPVSKAGVEVLMRTEAVTTSRSDHPPLTAEGKNHQVINRNKTTGPGKPSLSELQIFRCITFL